LIRGIGSEDMTGSGNDDCVKVERLGGLGGFGLPG
jgi:hypothetical protein